MVTKARMGMGALTTPCMGLILVLLSLSGMGFLLKIKICSRRMRLLVRGPRMRLLAWVEGMRLRVGLKACDRLAVQAPAATHVRFLDAGVCIGLLDPVSNIMANTLVTSDLRPGLMDKVPEDTKPGEMDKRSLDGLVAFLIYFFPYLAEGRPCGTCWSPTPTFSSLRA
ncbi:hypothetical protein TRIUR3_23830 [Triticum urartu]|uniref:PIR2-like helical domain-containing protein n=1 Tax=Triticum urartu TaxID=4572 RepID=M8A002_TRIUA|nr:hypothetical protein TRIUR3_23830 [Triticum urartu]